MWSAATRPNHSAMRFISASPKPRVVTAGVPTRTPDVTKGLSGSKGMVFLFTVMPARSSASSKSFPVNPFERMSSSIRWLSVPPVTSVKPSSIRYFARAWALSRIFF